jgi:ABC-type multidrug transport system fused ATPase/permease subunit
MAEAGARRASSEYSASHSGHSKSSAIKVSKLEQKAAQGRIYKYLFSDWMAKVALIPSAAMGAMPMIMYHNFGNITTTLTEYYMSVMMPPVIDPMPKIWDSVVFLMIAAAFAMVAKFFDTFFWIRIGSYLSTRLKNELFENMMRSDVLFFDINPIGGILTLLSEDAQQVEDAFGQIKGTQITCLAQFLIGIIMAFTRDWRMALVGLCSLPPVAIVTMILMPGIVKSAQMKFKRTAAAITIAEETISSVRTVKGCNREDAEVKRFRHECQESQIAEQSIGKRIVVMIVVMTCSMWGVSIVNMYFGATLVDKGDIKSGDMFSIFGYTMFGVMGLVMLQATMQGEQKAISAGARILKLAAYKPSVPFEGGETIDDFKGHIEFRSVSFKYPTRDVYVLRNVSFEIKPCQMGALVGHSGSGKSTCVQLLERYYDIEEGAILLDGKDIKTLDPHWLHQKIALVQQEPSLFIMSIRDNIKYGTRDATDEQVYAAAEVANARNFIERKVEGGFDAKVGEKGSTLSGGQRQRVAIARAVIKNPVILITDEATSALDADSEKKVQVALDKVMENRTAVVVAHRLSTIRNAHIIYVFDAGEIVEQGTHDELVTREDGKYFNLVRRQLMQDKEVKEKSKVSSEKKKSDAAPPKKSDTAPPKKSDAAPPKKSDAKPAPPPPSDESYSETQTSS